MNISGKWKGVIVYGPEYEELENQELHFTAEFTQNLDEFTGIAKDVSGIGCNPDTASIRGFIENQSISFIKQYTSTLLLGENGQELDRNTPGPEINYWGEYDINLHQFSGHWEIYTEPEALDDGWIEYICSGTWTMKRFY